jgi:hypothetical protein
LRLAAEAKVLSYVGRESLKQLIVPSTGNDGGEALVENPHHWPDPGLNDPPPRIAIALIAGFPCCFKPLVLWHGVC